MDSTKPVHMPYKLLEEITDDFSDENLLGSGGFGVVHKGVDKNGQEIAVKMLKSMELDDKEFRKELDNISGLKHPNIVQLVGFCSEDEEEYIEHNEKYITAVRMRRALCFEYMPNGSLYKYLSDDHQGLSWQTRYRIIKGICEGLKYLHTELSNPICHLDLKPANILLDKKMTPKIADFGMSRLIGEENTKRTANLKGTFGFMPPEFLQHQLTSKEYDIYSLGVIIIKIMVGRRVYSLIGGMKPAEIVEHVQKEWRQRLQEIPGYMSFEVDCEQVNKCIEIASKCIEAKKIRRPSIEHIVDLLSKTERHENDLTPRTEEVVSLKPKSTERNQDHLDKLNMTLSFLKEITDNFSPERQIERTAFGTLYKGILQDGEVILVVRLHKNSLGPLEKFSTNKIGNLVGLHHENIVKLVGFCYETTKQVVEHNGRNIIVDVSEILICYEYLALGSLNKYIYSNKIMDWDTRFNIIMGICKGLNFLHTELDNVLIHLDITSANILLDYNWVPKIGNFDLLRLLGQEQTRMNTQNIIGRVGHLAPEYLYRGEISTKTDIYSLGLLIIEITTGEELYPSKDDTCGINYIKKVHKIWTNNDTTSKYSFLDEHNIQQAKACIEMALQCAEVERDKRPSIVEIMKEINKIKEITAISTVLLDIYPPRLRFASTPNKSISRILQLRNKSQDCIAVRLQSKGSKRFKMPLFGILPPRSTYTLVVTTREQKKELPNNNETLTLESVIIREGDFNMKLTDADSIIREYKNIFKKANSLHELTLPVVVCGLPEDATTSSHNQIISCDFVHHVLSVDVHPTKTWIMTSHYRGNVVIWDYNKQERKNNFEISTEPVYTIKFIEREQWLVAGDRDGTIYVYNYYYPEKEVTTIEKAHDNDITSLDVHPTEHFMLSSSDDHLIKLWDWENGWECARIFEGHSDRVTQVNFIPTDTNCFASASLDHTIRLWSISSSESKMILCDRPNGLLCVHNYISNNRKYLISGFGDGTVQVWRVRKKTCVQTFQAHLNCVSSICSHPELGVLITGSYDGTVRVWNSNTYRLENILGVNLGAVYALGYIESIKRVVIGCYQGIAIVELVWTHAYGATTRLTFAPRVRRPIRSPHLRRTVAP